MPAPTVLLQGQVRVADKAVFDRPDKYSVPHAAEYFDPDPDPVPCPLSFDWGRDRRRYGDAKKSLVEAAVAPAPVAARSTIRNKAVGVTVKTQGVTVETQHTLKEYGSIGLSATQPDGLEIWLAENG